MMALSLVTENQYRLYYKSLLEKSLIFDLHINLNKCELYWPSGDQTFPEFPVEVRHLSEGI